MGISHVSAATGFSVSPLLDAAAALEISATSTQQQLLALQRDYVQLRQRLDLTRQWFRMIQRYHRTKSHAETTKLIARALATFDPARLPVGPGSATTTKPASTAQVLELF